MKRLLIILFFITSIKCYSQHYAVMTHISDSLATYYVYPDTAVLLHPDIVGQFERDDLDSARATTNAAPVYNFIFNVTRPVKNNQSIDGYVVFAKDPERTIVSHYCQSGTGKNYFYTDRYKGGIRVKDFRAINRAPRTWTYDVYCYDATRLYCVAFCKIIVK